MVIIYKFGKEGILLSNDQENLENIISTRQRKFNLKLGDPKKSGYTKFDKRQMTGRVNILSTQIEKKLKRKNLVFAKITLKNLFFYGSCDFNFIYFCNFLQNASDSEYIELP